MFSWDFTDFMWILLVLTSIWDLWRCLRTFKLLFLLRLATSTANGFVRTYLNIVFLPPTQFAILIFKHLNMWVWTMESFGALVLFSRTTWGGCDQGRRANLWRIFFLRLSAKSLILSHVYCRNLNESPLWMGKHPHFGWLKCKFHAAGRSNGLPRHATTLHSDQGGLVKSNSEAIN